MNTIIETMKTIVNQYTLVTLFCGIILFIVAVLNFAYKSKWYKGSPPPNVFFTLSQGETVAWLIRTLTAYFVYRLVGLVHINIFKIIFALWIIIPIFIERRIDRDYRDS